MTKIMLIKFGSNVSEKDYSFELLPRKSYQSSNTVYKGEVTAVIKNEY